MEVYCDISRSDHCGVVSSGGLLVCWGCGEHGQHCHGRSARDVHSRDGLVKNFGGCDSGIDALAAATTRLGVVSLACGSSHTVALTESNEVYSWGNGSRGQLGTGDREIRWQPTRIDVFSDMQGLLPYQRISGICCGGRQTFVWFESGQTGCFGRWAIGSDDMSSAACGSHCAGAAQQQQAASHIPRLQLLEISQVKLVSCGENHSVFLFQDGTVGACGLNSVGQLGTGDRVSSQSVRMLDNVSDITTVACGAEHSLALSESGKLFVWGYGKAIGFEEGDALEPTQRVHHNTNIMMLAGGRCHCVVLTENGNVYTWGSGTEGQLGHGQQMTYACAPRKIDHSELQSAVVQVAAGDLYSAAVTRDGRLFMWGKNSHVIDADRDPSDRYFVPELVPTTATRVNFVACGAWHAACIVRDKGASSSEACASSRLSQIVTCDLDNTAIFSDSMNEEDISQNELPVHLDLSSLSSGVTPSSTSAPVIFDVPVAQLRDNTSRGEALKTVIAGSAIGATARAGGVRLAVADGYTAISHNEQSCVGVEEQHTVLHPTDGPRSNVSKASISGLGSEVETNDPLPLPFTRSSRQTPARKPASDVSPAAPLPLFRSDTIAGYRSFATSSAPGGFLGQLTRTASDVPDRPLRHAVLAGFDGQVLASDARSRLISHSLVANAPDLSAVSDVPAVATAGPPAQDALFLKDGSAILTKPTTLRALPPPQQLSLRVQLKQQQRETPEEKLLREMRARHEELFMKEKALRRKLLPRGALQRLPLATQGSSVALKAFKENHPDTPDGGRIGVDDARLAEGAVAGRHFEAPGRGLGDSNLPSVAATSTRLAVALRVSLGNGLTDKDANRGNLQSSLPSAWRHNLPYLSRNS